MEELKTLASARTPRGELVLRARRRSAPGDLADPVHELVVNGMFAMDSVETRTERELAALAAEVGSGSPRILVGGLGLGYTAAALLDDDRLNRARLDVVELEADLVRWAEGAVTPVLGRVAADPRVRLHVADVTDVLLDAAAPGGPWDAVLLDVDNGPDFLLHEHNDRLYDDATLRAGYGRLAEGGVLAVWCQGAAPELLARLQALGPTREHTYRVQRGRRQFCYVIYALHRAGSRTGGTPGTPRSG